VTYAEVEDTLRYLGPDSSAIVAPALCAGSARVFLVVNIRGEIHGYDSASESLIDWPPPRDHGPAYTFVGYLNDRGDPLLPLGERADRRFTYWLRMDEAWAELSEADRSQLVQDIVALNGDFASAMARGVEPGSEPANALAERHLALFLRIFVDYGYESHRADGRPLVTDGRLRDPLEWIAPGSARYVRDVIVANAKHHLGQDRKTVRWGED
jgi:hypothetical protein